MRIDGYTVIRCEGIRGHFLIPYQDRSLDCQHIAVRRILPDDEMMIDDKTLVTLPQYFNGRLSLYKRVGS